MLEIPISPWTQLTWTKIFKYQHLVLILFCGQFWLSQVFGIIAPTARVLKVGINNGTSIDKEYVKTSLQTIHDIATENVGTLCVSKAFRPLEITLNTERYDGARQKADLAAVVLQDVGVNRHGGLLDALSKGLLSDEHVISALILVTNTTNGILGTSVWWVKSSGGLSEPHRIGEDGMQI